MYEFLAIPDVVAQDVGKVTRKYQEEGNYSVEQMFLQYTSERDRRSYSPHFTVVFKRTTPEQSHGQFLLNRAHEKLREVSDRLRHLGMPTSTLTALADDIDKFLFTGSPEDM